MPGALGRQQDLASGWASQCWVGTREGVGTKVQVALQPVLEPVTHPPGPPAVGPRQSWVGRAEGCAG